MPNKEEIIKKYPSKCWNCDHSGNVSDALLEQGYCGCLIPLKYAKYEEKFHKDDVMGDINADEMGLGWVQLSEPFVHGGIMHNDMLITKNVTECKMDKVVQSLGHRREIRERIEELEDEIKELKNRMRNV